MSADKASATASRPATTKVTRFPVLRPVELAVCSRGRLDVVVLLGGREVTVDESSPSAVVAVRASVVLGAILRVEVEGETVDPEPLLLVVVERARTLVEVEGAAVVELALGVVVVGISTVVLDSTSVVGGRVTT